MVKYFVNEWCKGIRMKFRWKIIRVVGRVMRWKVCMGIIERREEEKGEYSKKEFSRIYYSGGVFVYWELVEELVKMVKSGGWEER